MPAVLFCPVKEGRREHTGGREHQSRERGMKESHDKAVDGGPGSGRNESRTSLLAGITVLYEDDAIVALNKPAKLLAVPAENSGAPSALSLLSAELKHKRQRAGALTWIATPPASCCLPKPGRIARRWCGSFSSIVR